MTYRLCRFYNPSTSQRPSLVPSFVQDVQERLRNLAYDIGPNAGLTKACAAESASRILLDSLEKDLEFGLAVKCYHVPTWACAVLFRCFDDLGQVVQQLVYALGRQALHDTSVLDVLCSSQSSMTLP